MFRFNAAKTEVTQRKQMTERSKHAQPSASMRPASVPSVEDERKGALKKIGGSMSDHWNWVLSDQTIQTLWIKNSDQKTFDRQMDATLAVLMGIAPKDELEGMMAAQLIASHNAAMECYRRAMLGDQTFEGRRENLTQANKLSRTWATLLETLNRHRGKGQQKVTVEHVHVHAGGQAMVGTIEASRDRSLAAQEELNAAQITDASEPALPGSDQTPDPLPVPRDEEWPLPHARRKVSGSTER
jgi:hypothetical protein